MAPNILMIDSDSSGLRIRGYVLRASGFDVTITSDPENAKLLLNNKPSAIISSLNLRDKEGQPLLPQIRQRAPGIPLIALTDTPYGNDADGTADRFVLKLDGPKALLSALDDLLRTEAHNHSEFQSERVVFVDRERRYIDATDKACELIGYQRTELLGKRIEDLAAEPPRDIQKQFTQYVIEGSQQGVFELRHKDGHLVRIKFRAIVLPDGCLAAEWEPLNAPEHPHDKA